MGRLLYPLIRPKMAEIWFFLQMEVLSHNKTLIRKIGSSYETLRKNSLSFQSRLGIVNFEVHLK